MKSKSPFRHNTEYGEQDNGVLYEGVEDAIPGVEDASTDVNVPEVKDITDTTTTPPPKVKPPKENNPLDPMEGLMEQDENSSQTNIYDDVAQNSSFGIGENSGSEINQKIGDLQRSFGKGSAFSKKGSVLGTYRGITRKK